MKYKMIVSDFDGTLYTDDYRVTDETLSAVKDYVGKGGRFFIATGRLFQAIKPFTELFGLADEVVTYQGSGVYNIANGEMVMSYSIDTALSREIFDYIYRHYSDVTVPMLFYNDRLIVEEKNPFVDQFCSIVKVSADYAGVPLSEYVSSANISPNKMLTLISPDRSAEVAEDLLRQFGDKVNVNRSSKVLIEMVNKSASKGAAVRWLAEKYGISRDDIICFGDAENDISMIEYAGLGVAMGNAMDTVKNVSDMVCDTNNNNGVAKVIREIALKE